VPVLQSIESSQRQALEDFALASSEECSTVLEEVHARLLWRTTRNLDYGARRSGSDSLSDDKEVIQSRSMQLLLVRPRHLT
jgi:hypothetical protein